MSGELSWVVCIAHTNHQIKPFLHLVQYDCLLYRVILTVFDRSSFACECKQHTSAERKISLRCTHLAILG